MPRFRCGRIPAAEICRQLIGVHDVVPTFVELASGACERDQMLDAEAASPR